MTYTGNQLLGIEDPFSIVDNLVFYPVPVKDKINIRINVTQDAVITVALSDLAGRQLAASSYSLQKGLNDLGMNTGNLQPGIFILRINSSRGINISHKLIKTN